MTDVDVNRGAPRPPGAGGPLDTPSPQARDLRRFLVLFLLLLVAFQTAYYAWIFDSPLADAYFAANADLLGWMCGLFGHDLIVEGNLVVTAGFSMRIMSGCDAIQATLVFAAAVLAYPCTAAARARGLLLGVVVLAALNVLRLVTLLVVGAHWPEHFRSVHTQVWQALFILLAAALWLWWCLRTSRTVAPGDRR